MYLIDTLLRLKILLNLGLYQELFFLFLQVMSLCHWVSTASQAASSPADGSRTLKLQSLRSQRYRLWHADWHEPDMSSAAQSPTLRAEAITAPSEVQKKRNGSAFYSSSKRAVAIPRVVIFQFVSGWLLAAVCHTVDLEETFRDVMVHVFGPRQGRKTCSRGAKKLCGHTFLNSSSTAYSRDQNIRSSHANTAVTTSRFHSHI